MFFISQVTYVVADSAYCGLILQWNQALGIPNEVIYILAGSLATTIEHGFSFFPSFIIVQKFVPTGVESSMWSLSDSLIILNQHILRSTMGLIVNALFVNVTKSNMENYLYLKIIQALTSFLPFMYMFKLIPTLAEAQEQ